jgi:tRNA nucleotidyltransferase/poly(A) polymerase
MGKHIRGDVKEDLTVNALFYCNKEIIDLVGGVDDIKNNTCSWYTK